MGLHVYNVSTTTSDTAPLITELIALTYLPHHMHSEWQECVGDKVYGLL